MLDFRYLECRMIANPCYLKWHKAELQPTGITVHSTEPADGVIKRFVQPAEGQTVGLVDNGQSLTAQQMLKVLGKNVNQNDWNRAEVAGNPVEKAVHAFVGKLADGSYAVCKALSYTQPVWAAYKGAKGSYDGRLWTADGQKAGGPLHIQFEMIEDKNGDQTHCHNLYWTAVQFCAYLCRMYPSIRIEDIISHKEAHARGMASDHGDPEKYWAKCGNGYTMDGFRADVAALLRQGSQEPTPEPEPEPDGGRMMYRVQVGAFRNLDYAEEFLEQVRKHFPNAFIKASNE